MKKYVHLGGCGKNHSAPPIQCKSGKVCDKKENCLFLHTGIFELCRYKQHCKKTHCWYNFHTDEQYAEHIANAECEKTTYPPYSFGNWLDAIYPPEF
jgi:hypothetical protein